MVSRQGDLGERIVLKKNWLASAVVDGSLDNIRVEKMRSREHQQTCEGPAGFKNGPG